MTLPAYLPDPDLRRAISASLRNVPDFPRPGVQFKDITPLLADPPLFARVTRGLADAFGDRGVTHVAAIESRGFIFGAPVAQALGAAFVPLRKPGKLPHDVQQVAYALEYGSDALEAHVDACGPRGRVLIVDDVLATGGTAEAACRLVEALGATVVGCGFVLGLSALDGAVRLAGREVVVLAEV